MQVSGDVCPKCGVAVVPGYVRCPKCHFVMPARRSRNSIAPSGTAVEDRRSPVAAIVMAVAALGVVLAAYFLFRGSAAKPNEPPRISDQPPALPESPTPSPSPGPSPSAAPTSAPTGPSAESVASDLQRSLDHLRLWAKVEVSGAVVEVTSQSCADAAIKPVIDAAASRFKAAGTSRLRCRDESGTVVFTRDL